MIMRTILGLAALFSAAAAFVPAASARDWYVRGEIGQAADISAEGVGLANGLSYGGYVGTEVGFLRVEAGMSRINTDVMSVVEVGANDFNATAYLDFRPTDNSSVFLGAGADYITVDASSGFAGADATGLGWHLTGGYAHQFGPVIAEAQVRYISADIEGFNVDAVVPTIGVRLPL